MKILFANKYFFVKGGAEVVMFDEIELMRKNHQRVIEFSMEDPRNRPSNYSSYFVSNKSYRSASASQNIRSALSLIHSREAVRKISRLISDEKPDVLHCHNIYHQLTPSIINAAWQASIPVVLTLHDYKPICPVYTQLQNGETCTSCSDGRFEALLRRRCAEGSLGRSALLWAEARYHALMGSYDRVDKFIAPSRFMREAISRRFDSAKIAYIPNGIDVSGIKVSGEDDRFVIYLGRLSPEKGLNTLLRAHEADNAAWRLVVAGTGPLLSELKSRFPRAEFTGHLSRRDLQQKLERAAIVVVPSEWHENNPLSIIEAMAHGKPVIASRIGGIPELVREGETGFLFEPKNTAELSGHIRTLIENEELRMRLGRQARAVIESEFSLDKHGASLLAAYESVVGSPGRRRIAGM